MTDGANSSREGGKIVCSDNGIILEHFLKETIVQTTDCSQDEPSVLLHMILVI